MSQPPYPQGPGQPQNPQPQYPPPNYQQPPQQQNPYEPNPYQQPPGGGGGRPPGSSGSKTLLIVLGVVGGVFVLIALICGIFGYLTVRNVQNGMASFMEEMQEEQERMKKAQGEYWVETYRDNEKVVEKIGTISSHQTKTPKFSGQGPDQIHRVEIVGDKGTGHLVIEQDFSKGNSVTAHLVIDGEKILIDDDASQEEDRFSFGYDYGTGEFDDTGYENVVENEDEGNEDNSDGDSENELRDNRDSATQADAID